jgi:3-phenylpropionate/cinnamic acid dioxygenase small subunit
MSLEAREALRSAIHRSGRWLDDGRYDAYVGLFAADGEYRIEARAPEVKRAMTWMALDRDGLRQLLEAAPEHQWPIGERTHLIAVDSIDLEGDAATVASTFCVLRTDEGGRLDCYAAGRYDDLWIAGADGWRLRRRVVTLRNRLLAVPSPIPI